MKTYQVGLKEKKRNIHSSFWPKQTKEEGAKVHIPNVTGSKNQLGHALGLASSLPAEGGTKLGQPWCGRTKGALALPLAPPGPTFDRAVTLMLLRSVAVVVA